MLRSLNGARTRVCLLSSVAFISALASNGTYAQETLPEVTVQQSSVPQSGAPSSPESIDGEASAAFPQERDVGTTGLAVPLTATQMEREEIQSKIPRSSDTAELLRGAPGVSIFQAGGVSGLPAINGLNGDRVKVLLNGMVVTSACANQMNPPLSYADPSQIAYVEVISGATPVSKGGDSLGGTVIVESMPPNFADAGDDVHMAGSITAFYRSNGGGLGTSATAHAASNNVSVDYAGAWRRSDNYEDGHGNDVLSSEFEAQNHSVQVAIRDGGDLFIVQGGLQYIPAQGYVNQAMDMVENKGWFLNSRYVAHFGWGKLDARAFYQHTKHEMNFLEDKLPGDMPMLTDGKDAGYSIKAELPLSDRDLLRVGNEFHHNSLDDWWPPVAGSMMMGPGTYWNVNDGTRNRVGTFVEWERRWDRAWTTLLGARNDTVWMDAGDVAPYSTDPCMMMMGMMCMMPNPDAAAAVAFNARDRSRTDTNFDATALARYEPSDSEGYEFGYARKTRSPNLYERYTWGRGAMAMRMNGWFGDLNGYVGDPDLDPEVAHTVSMTAGWSSGARKEWEFKVTPYYTYVEDYIGVRLLSSAGDTRFLQFANHDAELYGVNFSGSLLLAESTAFGRFALTGSGGYVHGENADTGVSLYHMMPLHGTLALTHTLGGWTSAIELYGVAGKHNVDTVRNEMKTAGYALVNLSTSYAWERFRLDLGVTNVFDTYFEDPLGGHYVHAPSRDNVPGMGRSFNAGLTMKF